MRHLLAIPLGVIVLTGLASQVPAQTEQEPTTRPVVQGKDKKTTGKPRVIFHVVGMKKTKSGAT